MVITTRISPYMFLYLLQAREGRKKKETPDYLLINFDSGPMA